MDLELIYIIVVIAIVSLFIIAFLVVKYKGKKQEDLIDKSLILALIDPENVIRVEFVRNKIVILFKDVTLVNIESLHLKGVVGINVVGDKIKFYIEGSNEKNENLYNSIKDFVEGKW